MLMGAPGMDERVALKTLLNIKLDLFYLTLKRIQRAQLFFLEGQENFLAF